MTAAEELRHLLDVIRRSKPRWALLTTYTFSVSYFDAVFVPALRSAGCERIDVLVDATEAALSCQEHASRQAGRVYRIVPVRVPERGIFHPKLAFLTGGEADVLSIGSGNLTASGQSLQLESIDVVAARDHPHLFGEFADWLELVARKVGPLSAPAAEILMLHRESARVLARRSVQPASGSAPARLIHPLVSTARAALAAYYQELFPQEAAPSLVVLSPYHAPDAAPILDFARDIGAANLQVGIDGRRLHAPFAESRLRAKDLSFVVAESAENRKPLHAKVFEIQTPAGALVLSGSINATRQSFDSHTNIELSLARRLDRSPFEWRTVQPLAWEPIHFSAASGRSGLWVAAWLETTRELRGVVGAHEPLERAVLELSADGSVVFLAEVSVGADGRFATPPLRDLDTSAPHILRVVAGELDASCWVNLCEELDLTPEDRDRKAAVQRVLRGDYDFHDVAHVIHLLSMLANAAGGTPGTHRATQASDADQEVPFDVGAWELSGKSSGGSIFLGRAPYELLRAINRWIAKDVDQGGRDGRNDSAQAQPTLDGGTDEQAEAERGGAIIDLDQLIDRLCLAIPTALERGLRSEHAAILVEVAAARALQRSRKHRLEMAPCLNWLQRFSRFAFDEAAAARVQEVAAAMAAATAWGFEDETGKPAPLSLLRECMERLAGRRLEPGEFDALTVAGLQHETFAMLAAHRDPLLESAARIAAARTVDDDLVSTLRQLATLGAADGHADKLPAFAAAFRTRPPKGEELSRGVLDERLLQHGGCPICSLKLESDEVAELRRSHVLHHRNGCRKLIFFSERAVELRTALTELTRAQ